MAKGLSKKELIAELSETTELTQKDVKNVLDRLAKIAYRETVNGFTVPGICKLKIARRKASKCRNPATSELMLIAEHDIVKIIPLKKAKDAIAPKTKDLVTVIEETVEKNAPEPEQDDLFTFVCSTCGQEIEAPTSMRGMEAECPTCGNDLIIGDSNNEQVKAPEIEQTAQEPKEQPPANTGTNTMRLDLSNLGFN